MSDFGLLSLSLRPGQPDFIELPWRLPLAEWSGATDRVVELQRGLSRHEVVFVEVDGAVWALKELPPQPCEREYQLLRGMEERRLPAVTAAGHARARVLAGGDAQENGILITRYLEGSLPYRTLFMQPGLERYRERLLDAMAGLLVRLHLAGFYWGDCSLSNTLFRRDAGELQAYMVDAETSAQHEKLSHGQRALDLDILEENVTGELGDLSMVVQLPPGLPVASTGQSIRARYQRLWSEIDRQITIGPGESFRIQERIRALNELGFSVGELELVKSGEGDRLRLRTIVVDRDYHRRTLHGLTGLIAGDRQAALLLNEVKELQATLSRQLNRSLSLSQSAYRWMEQRYRPAVVRLKEVAQGEEELAELYCQVLEHKWYLSERAGRDVGLEAALDDYLASRGAAPQPADAAARDDAEAPVAGSGGDHGA